MTTTHTDHPERYVSETDYYAAERDLDFDHVAGVHETGLETVRLFGTEMTIMVCYPCSDAGHVAVI